MAALKIEYISLSKLKPYEKNARKHQKADLATIENSIREFGMCDPIGIWSDKNIVVEGHGRLLALKALGETEAPCIRLDHLTDEQRRAYALAHNKTAEMSEWDFDLLSDELEDILDIDMTDFGFEFEEEEESTEVVEDDYDVELPEEPKAKVGDIYQLGRHRLMCGDSTDAESVYRLMDGKAADMVMTDPPYGIRAEKMTMGTGRKDFHRGDGWDNERPDISVVFDLAPLVCIWGGNYFADVLPVTNDWLIWHKKNDGLSFSECELAWTNFDINCRHISHHWGKEKKQHVTMKPLAVIAWAIERAKEKANVIVDLYGGSGTTMLACEQLKRTCYMMELDPKYVDVIISRWEQFTGEKAVLINGDRGR